MFRIYRLILIMFLCRAAVFRFRIRHMLIEKFSNALLCLSALALISFFFLLIAPVLRLTCRILLSGVAIISHIAILLYLINQ